MLLIAVQLRRRVGYVVGFLMGIATIALAVALIVTLVVLPNRPRSGKVDVEVFRSGVVSLGSFVNYWWLASMGIAFIPPQESKDSVCLGKMTVVNGITCSNLPVTEIPFHMTRIYLVPPSYYNVTVVNSSMINHFKPHLWCTTTVEAYYKLQGQLNSKLPSNGNGYECSKNYSDATCFPLAGKSFVVCNVTRPGYYSLTLADSSDNKLSTNYSALSKTSSRLFAYDVAAIENNVTWQAVDGGKKRTSVKMSEPFHFPTQSCALLSFSCDVTYTLSLGQFVRRWDIPVVLITCPWLAILLVLSVTLLTCCACICYKLNRSKRVISSDNEDTGVI